MGSGRARPTEATVTRLLAAVLAAVLLSPATPARALGPEDEVTGPAGAPGAVIVIHGGNWVGGDPALVEGARAYARRFDDAWQVHNVDHRSGRAALGDLLAVVDALRAERGPRFPICVVGGSAGGYWALMLAERRALTCAIAESAPTNLLTLDPSVRDLVTAVFGRDERTLARWSPALHAARLRAPVLLVYAENDPLVAPDQAAAVLEQAPHARLLLLPAGDRGLWHVHSPVDAAALRTAIAAERQLVAESMGRVVAGAHEPIPPRGNPGA